MPFVNKNKRRHKHTTWLGIFRVNKTERHLGPDQINSITIPWFAGRKTIWERAK